MNEFATPTILLVEDDLRLAGLISEFFEDHGFRIVSVSRGDSAIAEVRANPPDVMILDIGLPGVNGFDVCRNVRNDYAGLILMLTARDDDVDQIVGLEIGADDYVTKPVEPRVLLARVRALLRRSSSVAGSKRSGVVDTQLQFGALQVNARSRSVLLGGCSVELTTTEFDLLWLIASRPGEVLARGELFKQLRGLEYDGLDRSIDIGISRLRGKLGDTENPAKRIKTVRGRGYLFVEDAW